MEVSPDPSDTTRQALQALLERRIHGCERSWLEQSLNEWGAWLEQNLSECGP